MCFPSQNRFPQGRSEISPSSLSRPTIECPSHLATDRPCTHGSSEIKSESKIGKLTGKVWKRVPSNEATSSNLSNHLRMDWKKQKKHILKPTGVWMVNPCSTSKTCACGVCVAQKIHTTCHGLAANWFCNGLSDVLWGAIVWWFDKRNLIEINKVIDLVMINMMANYM